MGFLTGKKILVAGIASNRSIAYGIAKAMKREGAELAFSYPNDKMKARVDKFAAELDSDIVLPCDVANDDDITNLFIELNKTWMAKQRAQL
jgi:enoyl-[acyl-carrier protein] reductase I